jgi:Protein of unknown function (DUF3558)
VIGVVCAPRRSGDRAFPVVTLIALAIATAACSSPGPIASASLPASTDNSSGQASAVNPCELVTSDEASSLLGGTTQRTGPTDENQLVGCEWATGQGANLLVTVGQGAGLYDPDLTNPGWKSVSALGDKAYSDAVTQTVGFIKGSTVVVLYVPAVQPVDMVDLEALARAVVGRLESS